MTVYIEYAFLENFLYDGAFLCLALLAAREKIRWRRIALSASFGAVFAIVFPLLNLPKLLGLALKLAVGFLLCFLAFGRIKGKKAWGRYALTATFFFVFAFSFGGALTGVTQSFFVGKAPTPLVALCFCLLSALSLLFVRKLYERKSLHAYIYECEISALGKSAAALGYFDSGNTATKNSLPVCFVSPDLIFDLFGSEYGKDGRQVCDEMQITTMSGQKTIPLYKGMLSVKIQREKREMQVYFAPNTNMIRREYKILLSARIFEG